MVVQIYRTPKGIVPTSHSHNVYSVNSGERFTSVVVIYILPDTTCHIVGGM